MIKSEKFFLKNRPTFLFGLTNINQLKNSLKPEVAFIGKSNVGKSSLINAITYSKVSISSKTPGRTRELNFFNIGDKINLVDMPGYGFSKTSNETKDKWIQLIYDYFYYSKNLRKVFLLISCKKNINDDDFDLMSVLNNLNINYTIVLTKSDICNLQEIEKIKDNISKITNNYLIVSARKNYDVFKIRDEIHKIIIKC